MGKCIICGQSVTSKEFDSDICWDCESASIREAERKGGYRNEI